MCVQIRNKVELKLEALLKHTHTHTHACTCVFVRTITASYPEPNLNLSFLKEQEKRPHCSASSVSFIISKLELFCDFIC